MNCFHSSNNEKESVELIIEMAMISLTTKSLDFNEIPNSRANSWVMKAVDSIGV